jgi:3',5'-cyclic AMP phosphodiesterase CpdA
MKIIHLSDTHFGRQTANLLPAFAATAAQLAPDLVIISGDFTQHARHDEFTQAQAFLAALPCPFFAVPGNHDIPSANPLERFFDPYKRYRRYISPELCPRLETPMAVIAGLNSARRFLPHWNWANGAISGGQLQRLRRAYAEDEKAAGRNRWRICTFHHPIHKVEDSSLAVTVFGAKDALRTISELKVDLVLTGHVHYAGVAALGDIMDEKRGKGGHKTLYVSASTTLSSRLRGQENGFNLITLQEEQILVDIYTYQSTGFASAARHIHPRSA